MHRRALYGKNLDGIVCTDSPFTSSSRPLGPVSQTEQISASGIASNLPGHYWPHIRTGHKISRVVYINVSAFGAVMDLRSKIQHLSLADHLVPRLGRCLLCHRRRKLVRHMHVGTAWMAGMQTDRSIKMRTDITMEVQFVKWRKYTSTPERVSTGMYLVFGDS